jgi:phage tail sheath protein FI
MAIQLSPGVNVSEIDQTTVVPSVPTTAGAFVGTFSWGPVMTPVLVNSGVTLREIFSTPDSNSAVSFFSASNFLSYGNNLSVVRAVGANSVNATANNAGLLIQNEDAYLNTYLNADSGNAYGSFASRYPGVMGNSLKVSVCANTSLFSTWEYKGFFSSAPGTSDFATSKGATNDEMHIVVIDANGMFGQANTVLETYAFVSKAGNAIKANDGSPNYYKEVLFDNSSYVYAMDPPQYATTNATWGDNAANGVVYATLTSNFTTTLGAGRDEVPLAGNITTGWDLFANKEEVDVSLLITGDAGGESSAVAVQNHVISLAESRRDCIAFVSPLRSDVVNAGSVSTITTNVTGWVNSLSGFSSYAVADSGWKYQLDQYNNVYRWIPLNADIAGTCAFTDSVRDPWYSPAGFNRGLIRNAIKLAWNPSQTYRDTLYSTGVNPVVSFQGQGIILFGDKTLQAKPSAFDRINVRRLFITLEKSISRAARFSLFEINDAFTRSQFISIVEPFLRDVQGRGGITDFLVVCDSTNNTPQVIDSNQFVGDIYIKPARSINFIQLNFVAVGTGTQFTTITGG